MNRYLASFGILFVVSAAYHFYLSSLLFDANPGSLRKAFEYHHSNEEIARFVGDIKLLKLHFLFYIPTVGLFGLLLVGCSFMTSKTAEKLESPRVAPQGSDTGGD